MEEHSHISRDRILNKILRENHAKDGPWASRETLGRPSRRLDAEIDVHGSGRDPPGSCVRYESGGARHASPNDPF